MQLPGIIHQKYRRANRKFEIDPCLLIALYTQHAKFQLDLILAVGSMSHEI